MDSTIRIKSLIKETIKRGMGAVALTDNCNMFAMVKHYKACLAAGIKPIFGADVRIKNPANPIINTRLTLLCETYDGYLNLSRLISKAYLEGQVAGTPYIHIDWFEGLSEGIICLSAGLDSDLGAAIINAQSDIINSCLERYKKLFPNRFFIELRRTYGQQEETYNQRAIQLASKHQLPVVATNKVRFIDAEEFDMHEVRVAIHDGFTLGDKRRPKLYNPNQYLRSKAEMVELFKDIPEAIENTVGIAQACNVRLTLGKNYLPTFPIPQGHSEDSYFRELSEKGLEERMAFLQEQLPNAEVLPRQDYIDRLNAELDIIINMQFPGYFLIVADFIQWSKDADIPVGPGRGSGAGSLVAYALKITDLDPLEYDLLFERFLNPERVTMPDFDIDFCMDKRDLVIDYVSRTYGKEQVSQIITYGTMAAKGVIRDVGRVMGHPFGFVDRVAKLIPFEIGITLKKALSECEELAELYRKDDDVADLIDMGQSLEGLTRNVGKHAGGVVIAPSNLTDFTPVYCEEGGGGQVSQFDKNDVEDVGLVKFDFLGLRTLTIIDWALKTIARNNPEAVDIARIPLDDAATYELLKEAQTVAVFQLESRGMKDLIKRLRPDCFEDIIALVALFRPGPLQSGMVDDFIARKHGAKIEYPHPATENILKPTYGIILYQEQVMQIPRVLAGYSLGGADILRRAMGKKKPEEMAAQRSVFSEGCAKNDVPEKTATAIFDLIEKFAGYGFNKSHSAAYALVAYQTAWLKAHYPSEFMAAVLSADMDNTEKVVILVEECRTMGIDVVAPDINRSEYKFTTHEKGKIIYGLGAIKGIGSAAIDSIVAARENGRYENLDHFCSRVDLSKANKRVMEGLVYSGAFEQFSNNRAALLKHLSFAIQSAERIQKNHNAGMMDLFEDPNETIAKSHLPDVQAWDEKTRLFHEKDYLGLFLTGHPIHIFEKELKQIASSNLQHCYQQLCREEPSEQHSYRQKAMDATVTGLVIGIRVKTTNSGEKEAFITLDDSTGRIDVRVFPEYYAEIEEFITQDSIVIARGSVSYDDYNGGIRMRCQMIKTLNNYRATFAQAIHLNLLSDIGISELNKLKHTLQPYKQNNAKPLLMHQNKNGYQYSFKSGLDWSINPDEKCINDLQALLGKNQIHVSYK